MRKPSSMPLRVVPVLSIAVLALAACDRGKDAPQARVASAGPVAIDGAIVDSGLAGSTDARRELSMTAAPPAMDEKSMSAQAGPTAAAAPASVGFVSGRAVQRADIARGAPLPSIDVTGAMLVRHGQASIQVKTVDAAVISVRQIASQFGGFVANTSLRTGKDEQRSATLELRVPSDKFEGLLSSLSNLGKVETVTANAEDVAEEYVDLGARAANARRVEARLVEMLATRTGKLSDVLTVEQELARVRMEAERYDARLRWLERRASLSSLDITIHEPIPLLDTPRGPGPIAEALAEAWNRSITVLAWCIASLGLLVPLAVMIGIGGLVARRVWRDGTRAGAKSGGLLP
ncbi:MAG: hypothetical protein JWL95_509 [Gemmatimonadetes bacterium]|nr:hypothetical protein [Gemmatimonadota bacterium]